MSTETESDPKTHSLSVTLEDSDVHLESVYRSLLPEVGDIDGDSETAVEYDTDGDFLRIEVEADSLTSLRAGLNTWLRLARTANEALTLPGSETES
ncbi:MAG: KEOPS complex subunit Pcc1 [Halobacteria archaeon]|nr:KEOPS complex subunit Pcc1 [Halobacteria archaeon]